LDTQQDEIDAMTDTSGLDFYTTLGGVVIVSSAFVAIGSIVGMLYNVKQWVSKKSEERAEKTMTEAAKTAAELKKVTEDTAANLLAHYKDTNTELMARVAHVTDMMMSMQKDLDDMKQKSKWSDRPSRSTWPNRKHPGSSSS
jgi:hypothetical protein